MRYIKILLLILILTTSCKKTENKVEKELIMDKFFSVEFSVKADKPDDFTVYWSEDKTNNFDGTRAVWGGIKGQGIDETITIKLPEQIVPTNVRLDFGIKPEKENVILKNLEFNFYGNKFNIRGSEFLNYFIVRPEIKTTIDNNLGTITFSKTEQLKDGYYYYPKQELLEKIKLITTQKKE